MARILLVEDDLSLRLSLAASLRAEGHDLNLATMAEEAARVAEQEAPELVGLD